MNLLYKILLICCLALPLSACAQKTLPPWQGEPLTVQFSARAVPQASELPVQGGLRMTQHGGTLGLILQHGRTLGQCYFEVHGKNAQPDTHDLPHDLPNESPRALRLQCRAAEGVGSAGQSLLQRVALAVYRALPAVTALPTVANQPTPPTQPWRVTHASPRVVTTSPAATTSSVPTTTPQTLQRLMYEDSLGSVDIVFSEVRRP